ncbi:MAG TPA: ROK family transcriptional regulator [Lapillicoccus sp.]|nr:ROK family transcriptional regulator [Lapillicoccus sp.]
MTRRAVESSGPGSVSALRSANQGRILGHLESGAELTQAELARATGLAPATVSNIVRGLVADGVLAVSTAKGQPKRVRLQGDPGVAVGIDYGHRHVTVAAARLDGEILAEDRIDLGSNVSAAHAVEAINGLFHRVLDHIGVDESSLVGLGMGLPAPIDSSTGQVGSPSILPGWVGVDAAKLVSARLGMPVHVDNDANLGALGELRWGNGRGIRDFAYIKLSEGVGAGLIVNGELFRGRNGIAGEIGHTTMDEFGTVCRCGNRGCLETIAAARTVIQLLEPVRGPGLTIAEVVRLAEEGDAACARVLADTGRHVGAAVANLCNVFNPERILIGGELAQAGELLLTPLREVVRRQGIPTATANLQILPAELGARAQVLGALNLAMSQRTLGFDNVHELNA